MTHRHGILYTSSAHRVGRVLSFFSCRRNWDSPIPSTAGECAPPTFGSGGPHSLAGEGVGESQFRPGDIHCDTLQYMCFVPPCPYPSHVQIFNDDIYCPQLFLLCLLETSSSRKKNVAHVYFCIVFGPSCSLGIQHTGLLVDGT